MANVRGMDENVVDLAPRTVTVAEASRLSGLSEKAIRRRIERGTLSSVRHRDGSRRVPLSELKAHGVAETAGAPDRGMVGNVPRRGAPQGADVISELVDRVQQQAEELGRLRAITVQAESLQQERDRLEAQLLQERSLRMTAEARLAVIEAQPRRRRLFGR